MKACRVSSCRATLSKLSWSSNQNGIREQTGGGVSTHFTLLSFPSSLPPYPWTGYGLLGSPRSLKKISLSRQSSGESVTADVDDRFETHDPESIHALMNEGALALAKVLSVPVHWARAILSSHDWNLKEAAFAWRNSSGHCPPRSENKAL